MTYYNSEKDFLGSIMIIGMGTSPTTPLTIIPSSRARPKNPYNKHYLPAINKSVAPSIRVTSKRTPTVTISSYFKSNWATAAFFNNLIINSDLNFDTETFSIGFYQATAGIVRQYDFCKCTRVEFANDAEGGAVTVEMDFEALGGESELTTTTLNGITPIALLASQAATSAGDVYSGTVVNWVSTASQVASFRATIVRGQARQAFQDGTLYDADISSGQFSGVLTVEQSPNAEFAPSTGATLNIGTTGSGISLGMLLSADDYELPKTTRMGRIARSYSMFDATAGAIGVTITAL